MQWKLMASFIAGVLVLPLFAQYGAKFEIGKVLSSNSSGTQGDYHVEYWKDGGSGSMTLGEGGDFTCQWGQVNNILFRKGKRPGTKSEVITYKADYKPQGNSYLSIYGWFEDPLVEYYIIESFGSWNPGSDKKSKGTFESDSGTYTIFENSRTGASIKGNTTFQQYWSIRKTKRTSGVITCANHFAAWEKAGMKIGKFYEVSFNVEAYQSPGGTADVEVAIGDSAKVPTLTEYKNSRVAIQPINSSAPTTLYNILGQKIPGMPGMVNFSGKNSVMFTTSNRASGVYVLPIKNDD